MSGPHQNREELRNALDIAMDGLDSIVAMSEEAFIMELAQETLDKINRCLYYDK